MKEKKHGVGLVAEGKQLVKIGSLVMVRKISKTQTRKIKLFFQMFTQDDDIYILF